ncbi:uncharacterized protein PHACADRAFT_204277 [Phanerochaete carnosa HHB-10118-sp]|uniref:Uncharacterized protein n=1 Tax=Phanerochaete carnosa (strain HHB-10118-sp) TaxID=650164 RepID=K5WPF8_PHACS|nr:uncharacterized protein PHACADRAFT_204277 [Phanerochaete carnosa HHB-10118-sp]EKM61124.1 hypothetical protein PHACADRAFT_204277 [Phanerochaete carnosa HHB-10118-sp]
MADAPGRGTYTGTMYLMEDTTGKRSLDWIEKCWATLEEASFTRELDLYMKAQANKPLSCKPTSVQAWSTEESLYLTMKPPHPIGWRAAIHTLPKAKGRILDAYNLLFAHGVLRGYANLVDILIGDDGKVIIVTFMEAATTGHRRIGIPSCDNRDRELERHCVSTVLLDAGNRQVDEETGSKQGIPRQITRKDLYLQLQRGPKPADMSGPFAFFLSFPSYRSAARDTQPAPPALYATQTGLIEPELPQTRKGVRFGHGTMDNYIWNCAKEHSVSPLLRRAEIKKTKERQGNKKQRRATSQGNMPANSRPSPSTSELDHPSLIAQLVFILLQLVPDHTLGPLQTVLPAKQHSTFHNYEVNIRRHRAGPRRHSVVLVLPLHTKSHLRLAIT